MIIIGIGNKARNGKDTAGEAIVQHFNTLRGMQNRHGLKAATPEARIFKFADALYKEAREKYGMTEKDPTLLQNIGAERRIESHGKYWIEMLEKSMQGFEGIAVITDMRYENEADWVGNRGGYRLQVSRLNEDGTQYISPDRDPRHPSEIELDNYNFDGYIKSKSAALTAELAITHALYFKAMKDFNEFCLD